MDFDYAAFENRLEVMSSSIDGGAQGSIYVCIDRIDPKHPVRYALKRYYNLKTRQDQEEYLRELSTMLDLVHPALVTLVHFNLHGIYDKKKHDYDHVPYMMFPFYQKKSLHQFMNAPTSQWNNTKIMINLIGVAAGMKYLHENRIIHRDLKPENILLNDFLYPNISDFGLALRLPDSGALRVEDTKNLGTYYLIAPELFQDSFYGRKVDVYGYGVFMYWMFTHKYPFDDWAGTEGYEDRLKEAVCGGVRPDVSGIPSPFNELITRCWAVKTETRPEFSEIVDLLTKRESWLPDINEREIEDYMILIQEIKNLTLETPNPFIGHKEAIGDSVVEAFLQIDKDKNYNLDVDELAEFLHEFAPQLKPFVRLLMKVFGEEQEEEDENGQVTKKYGMSWKSFMEFYSSFIEKTSSPNYISRRIFSFIDDDQSGIIDFEELNEIVDLIDAPRSVVLSLLTKFTEMDYEHFQFQFYTIMVYLWKYESIETEES
ncbi:hypothetical protein M9Y10_014970 [Tritrichomonas musculus]|uniref:Calmodulin n=1 Tax=Tritrichomonas musculus TaxID=1915356 RepID=A0ABR2L1V2_9EUKA